MKKKMMFLIGFLLCSYVFAKSYSTFCLNGSYGLIDENRNIVIDPIYLEIKISEQEYIACRNGGTVDIYDPDTNKILSFADITIVSQYSEYEWLLHKYAVESKFILVNVKTKKESEFIHNVTRENLPRFVNGVSLILTYYDDIHKLGYSIMNKKGETLVSGIKQAGERYFEGLIPVLFFNGESGYVNEKGKMVIKVPLYEDPRMLGIRISPSLNYNFFEGVAFIQTEKDRWYLIDKKGNKKELPQEYDFTMGGYSNGLTVVQNNEHKFGYVDKNFELVIPFKFDAAFSFEGKYARVVYQEKDAIIDTAGNIYYCDELK